MDNEHLLGEFLRARRELVRPEDFGLPGAGRRRVAGLRREEVAMLAGVSSDYYIRLEQGRDRHPSEEVLDALGRALKLKAEELTHLRELARAKPRRRRPSSRPERAGRGLLSMLESMPHLPALVLGRYFDVLAANSLGSALLGRDTGNLVRMVFLDPAARALFPRWETVAEDAVAALRKAAGADVDDPRLAALVGELSIKSQPFARMWGRHEVRGKAHAAKLFDHPLVGRLSLTYETFTVNSAAGQQLLVYQADPEGPSAAALALLGSLVADAPAAHLAQPETDQQTSTTP
ncbi:helix-turn-helix transcriptional regulator [Sphaerisporangium sp. TRM90804]|uniref:helix-turn-helix domain-containing protein n=1 Tax=Sphaerisporangium sp. TRM90804 TaxID=3031113 RepID=UPI0024489290|nr:helix-turn-helix transcriptional regulator [Sphaerisporangium sp. TRM90804]MDH2426144.1 helix-turn-helix transcriptional regulator [Sphaerisporangium sp. TRM90804]